MSGDVSFSKNAVIYMGNCNAGTCSMGDPRSFAAELSKITGASVIEGDDSVGVGPEGFQVENKTSMIYWMYNSKTDNFVQFSNGLKVRNLGSKIDVVKLMNRVLKMLNPVTLPKLPKQNIKPITPEPSENSGKLAPSKYWSDEGSDQYWGYDR